MKAHPGIYHAIETTLPGKPPVKTVSYFQGKRARREQGSLVYLLPEETLTQLDAKRRVSRSIRWRQLKPGENPLFRDAKVRVTARSGGGTKRIQGQTVHNTYITSTAVLDLRELAKQAPNEEERRKLPRVMTAKIEAENWNTEKGGLVLSPEVHHAFAALTSSQTPMGKMMQPLLDAASRQAGMVLESTMTIQLATDPPQKKELNSKVVATTRTTFLERKPLPDSLFTIPPGYTSVPWDNWEEQW